MLNSGSRFYYSKLNVNARAIYDSVVQAVLDHRASLCVNTFAQPPFSVNISEIISAVLYDNPSLYFLDKRHVAITQAPMFIRFGFQYDYDETQASSINSQLDRKIRSFLDECGSQKMNQLQKQLTIHKYLTENVKTADPPFDEPCFSIVGALLNGKCVCEGFAKTYKLLCDYMGLASIVVTGSAVRPSGEREAHSWNITRIDGVSAHTDATWDTTFGRGAYDYFNLCDKEIALDHEFDRATYPKCDPNEINYFYKNALVASDISQLSRLIAANRSKEFFSIKLLFQIDDQRLPSLGFPAGRLRFNKAQSIIHYTKTGGLT